MFSSCLDKREAVRWLRKEILKKNKNNDLTPIDLNWIIEDEAGQTVLKKVRSEMTKRGIPTRLWVQNERGKLYVYPQNGENFWYLNDDMKTYASDYIDIQDFFIEYEEENIGYYVDQEMGNYLWGY